MGNLIIAGQVFDVDVPLLNWREKGWDATVEKCVRPDKPCGGDGTLPYGSGKPLVNGASARRYAFRPQLRTQGMTPRLDAVKALLTQLIFHHDGCDSAAMCWEVLHNERGLSCHFLCDNDGTIYQTLDLAYMAYHAAEYNIRSIGVEISNRGEVAKDPDYYAKRGQKRDVTVCKINGSKILCFDFTPAQYTSMRALCQALTRLLPNIPIEYPQDTPGHQSWNTLADAFSYKGYLGHYHCTQRKWDPGPFDFKSFCEKLRGQRCFPVWARKTSPAPNERPLVPSNVAELDEELRALYEMNEQGDGGYFPVGPWGEHRLWHGGVHLVAKEKAAIYAPFGGRVVAARMGRSSSSFGSFDFVLVRHDMTVGSSTMRFFALYMHLVDETAEADPGAQPPWFKKEGWQKAKASGSWDDSVGVALLDEPVEAGEIIGRVGRAGPDDKAQIHFEIFSEQQVLEKFPDARLQLYDGSGSGRFCDLPDIDDKIDTDKDGRLSRRELVSFFASPGERDQFRLVVTYNVSEWTAEPDWTEALAAARDFRDVKRADIEQLVAEQITPGLWWSDAVAQHAALTRDGLVYHYNPIHFVGYINQKIEEAAVTAPPPLDPKDRSNITGPAKNVFDDIHDLTGASAVTPDQAANADPSADLTIDDLVKGFP